MESNKEKRKLRIVFMGTPDFAVAGLKKLVESDYDVVGVITAPDKPAGRGRKIQESAVKKYALSKGLLILQPQNLKSEAFLEELKSLKPNLQIVVAFRMLPKAVWQIPEFGTFNLHASLLPQYRGAAPINWAIINGEKRTGVTTFFIDEKIDTGEIILQKETSIEPDEDAGKLHDKLMSLGADLILETVELIESGVIVTQKQSSSEELKFAPKIFREDCKIDWSLSMEKLNDFIRGLSPYPAAWTFFKNGIEENTLKVFKITIEPTEHDIPIGTMIQSKEKLKIAVNGGFVYLLEVQLSGKRKMGIKEVLNGLKIKEGAFVR